MTGVPMPDTENGVREWLRGLGVVGVGTHVFFGIPATVPDIFITVSRIGGGPVAGTTPLDEARLSLHVWGSTKKEAADAMTEVVAAVNDIEEEPLGASVYAYGGTVDSVLWQPAADTDRPRYVVDVTITARALVEAASA